MIPLKGGKPLTAGVVAVFNALRGDARDKAIATGNYDWLIERQKREPVASPPDEAPPPDEAFV
jgi:hypothetical protein